MSAKELDLCGGPECRVRVTEQNGAVILNTKVSRVGLTAQLGRDEQHLLMLFLQERLAR